MEQGSCERRRTGSVARTGDGRAADVRRELAAGELGSDDGTSLDLGIGGSRSQEHLKCLHAHVAFALARPGYELGERILAEVADPWPTDRCCSERLGAGD